MIQRLCIAAFFVVSLLASDATNSSRRAQELSYRHEQIPKGPWSTHLVIIDRSNHNLELQTTLPRGRHFGLATLSEQIMAFCGDGHVIAGINGDYFERHGPYTGDPQGLQIIHGELVSGPFDWACFWIDAGGKPNIGKVDSFFNVVLASGEKLSFGLNEHRPDDKAVVYTPAVGASTHTSGGMEFVLDPGSKGPQLPLRANERYFTHVTEIRRAGNSSAVSNRLILSIGPKLLSKISAPEVGDTVRVSTATSAALK